MSLTRNFTFTPIALLVSSIAFAAPQIPDAGSLSKELSQSQNNENKPSGEVFNSQLQSRTPDSTSAQRFQIRQIQLIDEQGESFNDDAANIINPYLNKMIGLADLNRLTQELTQYYREHNYLVARAILPPQQITDGTLKIQVFKGKIGDIHIENQSRLKPQWVERITQTSLSDSLFLQKDQLENLALLLNDIQGVKPALSLKAGKQTGNTDLTLSLENAKRYSANVVIDNQGNKDTGRYRLSLGGKLYNLLGNGDDLSLNVLSSNNANLLATRMEYSSLIDGYGTRLGVTGNYLRYRLGGNFKDLNANGRSHTLGIYIEHPTIRTPDFRLTSKVGFNHQQLRDKQQAVDLSQKRRINTVSLDVNASWNSVKDGISYFSVGTVFGNQRNQSNEPEQYLDENFKQKQTFTVVNYAISHEQYLPYSLAFNIGLNGQFADRNLDSSQKLLLGGLYAVRGYQSGAASVDEGHIFQAELKHYLPIGDTSLLTSSLYYDYGWGKYYKRTDFLASDVENKAKLQSVGAGLSLNAPSNYALNLVFSKPVGKKLENNDNHQVWFSAIKTF